MKLINRFLMSFIVASAFWTAQVAAGPATVAQTLTANLTLGGQNGVKSGEWAFVGNTTNCTVVVYRLNYATFTWSFFQIIDPSTSGSCTTGANASRGFSASISVSGSTAVIGAKDGSNSGTALVYQFNGTTWALLGTIPGDTSGSDFGRSVSILGDLIIVGAPSWDNGGGPANANWGRVYLYKLTGVTVGLITTLTGTTVDDAFGTAVWLHQSGATTHAVIGAPGKDTAANNAGAVFLYSVVTTTPGSATLVQQITPASGGTYTATASEALGLGVSEMSSTQILGAGVNSYVFTHNGTQWVGAQRYTTTNGGDVSHDSGVAAFGIKGSKVQARPDPLDTSYAAEATLTGGANLATHLRMYKNSLFVNDPDNNRAQSVFYPCGFGSKLLPTRWNIVNVPCNVAGKTINQVFNATGALGTYGTNWEVWGQDGTDFTSGSSTRLLTAATVVNAVSQGQAYWLKHTNASAVYWFVDSTQSTAFSTTAANPTGPTYSANVARMFAYTLPTVVGRGRALISNPFPRSFRWSDVHYSADAGTTATTLAAAVTASRLNNGIAYVYDPSILVGQPYRAVASGVPGVGDTIEVNEAFWIRMGTTPSGNDRLLLPLTK